MTPTTTWQGSEALRERAALDIPGGVNSNVRLTAPLVFFESAAGARLRDVDGNDYVDYVLGQGPAFLGHAHPVVHEAVATATSRGILFGGQHPGEVDAAAALLGALGWPEMVRLGMTGSECVQAALRTARAATGRTRFVRFEGHYHGWLDNVLLQVDADGPRAASAGQVASQVAESVVLPWNDAEALAALLAGAPEEFAAVIMEPVMVNNGSIEPLPGYLETVRELCDRYGVVLVFDEVITGFRLGRGGASARYGVTPDLATYGKAMAGGWPVAALAGRRDLMEPFGTGVVNHSGTFNSSVIATAAVTSTLQLLDDAVYARVESYGTELAEMIRGIGRAHRLPLRVQGPPAALHVGFGDPEPVQDYRALQRLDLARYARLSHALARHGVWATARGTWYVSAAHGERDLEDTRARIEATLAAVDA